MVWLSHHNKHLIQNNKYFHLTRGWTDNQKTRLLKETNLVSWASSPRNMPMGIFQKTLFLPEYKPLLTETPPLDGLINSGSLQNETTPKYIYQHKLYERLTW